MILNPFRTIGMLKTRFRILLKGDGVVHANTTKTGWVIIACSVLHNICVRNKIYLKDRLIMDRRRDQPTPQDNISGATARAQYINKWF